MREIEDELFSLKRSRDHYKHLYEKERATKDGKPILRDTDKTKLLKLRDFIDDLPERREYGSSEEG